MMTCDKIKEKYGSIIFSVIACILIFFVKIYHYLDMEKLVDKLIDYSSISFGFLLAVLAILLQSNTASINKIKEANKFNDLIFYNKKSVVSSLVLAIFCILYLALNLYKPSTCILNDIVSTLLLTVAIYQIIEVIIFLDLFYVLIKD